MNVSEHNYLYNLAQRANRASHDASMQLLKVKFQRDILAYIVATLLFVMVVQRLAASAGVGG